MPASVAINAQFPKKAAPLFRPAPYKVLHGGRSGAKSWSCARALLLLAARRKLFVVCGREVQKSIKESVHRLLAMQIIALGLSHAYRVLDAKIINIETGSEFAFVGVRNDIAKIKSMEAIDIFWLTEATFIPESVWEVLLPTVRRDPPYGPFGQGSEIWIDFNESLASDYTYRYWVVDPPEGTIVIEINWSDNPWFPEILNRQRLEMMRKDYSTYLNVWEGKTRVALAGSIYAKELAAAKLDNRISPRIHCDMKKPIDVAFDLGRADTCALWFMQQIGMEHHAVDYYGNTGFGIDHYIREIKERQYLVGKIILPHDAKHHHQSAKMSIKTQVEAVYRAEGQVRILPPASDTVKINAVRNLFPRLYFNEAATSDGVQGLAHYQFSVDPDKPLDRSQKPVHNWASHPADSLSQYALSLREGDHQVETESEGDYATRPPAGPQAWMVH